MCLIKSGQCSSVQKRLNCRAAAYDAMGPLTGTNALHQLTRWVINDIALEM